MSNAHGFVQVAYINNQVDPVVIEFRCRRLSEKVCHIMWQAKNDKKNYANYEWFHRWGCIPSKKISGDAPSQFWIFKCPDWASASPSRLLKCLSTRVQTTYKRRQLDNRQNLLPARASAREAVRKKSPFVPLFPLSMVGRKGSLGKQPHSPSHRWLGLTRWGAGLLMERIFVDSCEFKVLKVWIINPTLIIHSQFFA